MRSIATIWRVEWEREIPGILDGTRQDCATWEEAIHVRELVESVGQRAMMTTAYAAPPPARKP